MSFPEELRDKINEFGCAAKALYDINSADEISLLLVSLIGKTRILLKREQLEDVFAEFSPPALTRTLNLHPEFSDRILEACRTNDFSSILELEIFQKHTPANPPTYSAAAPDKPEFGNLHRSFLRPYVGEAVDNFFQYLQENNEKFRKQHLRKHYGKFCSIVQSSGTGKSRLLTELQKKNVVILYMNIRAPSDGYPERDVIPSEILTEIGECSQAEYTARCCAFFAATFTTLRTVLSRFAEDRTNVLDVIKTWNDRMCTMESPQRTKFFANVKMKYLENLRKILSERGKFDENVSGVEETGISGSQARKRPNEEASVSEFQPLKRLRLSKSEDDLDAGIGETDPEVKTPKLQGESLLRNAYEEMLAALPGIFAGSDSPQLVIGLDEAHALNQRTFEGPKGFKPSHILCRVINAYSRSGNGSVWVAFVSTTSKVADFSAPQPIHPSLRVASTGELLFPPYTLLGWDQNAESLDSVMADNVARFDHIAGFGRPLWKSLRSGNTPDAIMTVVEQKLCGSHEYDDDQALAILSQRFALDICFGHPDAVSHIEKGVASHLCVCYSTTEDRTWSFTGYPSEPLLSCAAAHRLHRDSGTLMKTLEVLERKVSHGMFEIGKSGELTSRLVLLLAKDLHVRKHNNSQDAYVQIQIPGGGTVCELIDCQRVPVVDYLQHMFGDSFWMKAGDIAKEQFRHAYVNFSHWVPMDGLISPDSEASDRCPPAEWTLRHWHRTSAVQCCHLQPLVDKMIPIYFDDPKVGPADSDRVSQIFISDKAGAKSNELELGSITRNHPSVNCASHLPYIAILLDLNGKHKLTAKFPEKMPHHDETDICLRIYASGVNSTTFPFLPDAEMVNLLAGLVSKPKEEPSSNMRLQALVKYGSTAEVSHMKWEEQGRTISTH